MIRSILLSLKLSYLLPWQSSEGNERIFVCRRKSAIERRKFSSWRQSRSNSLEKTCKLSHSVISRHFFHAPLPAYTMLEKIKCLTFLLCFRMAALRFTLRVLPMETLLLRWHRCSSVRERRKRYYNACQHWHCYHIASDITLLLILAFSPCFRITTIALNVVIASLFLHLYLQIDIRSPTASAIQNW